MFSAKKKYLAFGRRLFSSTQDPAKFTIGTYNAISPLGLQRFPESVYEVTPLDNDGDTKITSPHAILLRSFKLSSKDVPDSVRAVARCGAGVNNVDVKGLTKRGIPVFNSPGANANAVKELVVCSMFLASRGIVQGINHVRKLSASASTASDFESIKSQIEKDKKLFKGVEIQGKRLGVVGLGHIGAAVADSAIGLGMEVVGFDPTINVDSAWRLPGHILQRSNSLEEMVSKVDFLTLHTPYMPETHHLIDEHLLKLMKPSCHLINFARAELVDTKALSEMNEMRTGMYIADFADQYLSNSDKAILIPHLGASTDEAESNSAEMAANQVRDFIETGSVRNSVNFPTIELPKPKEGLFRLCIVNRNVPGMLGLITTTLGSLGINIDQHVNNSKEDLAYNVVDINVSSEVDVTDVQHAVGELEGVISSRAIVNKLEPNYFKVNSM